MEVQGAIEQLQASGLPVTLKNVSEIVGKHTSTLQRLPWVKKLLLQKKVVEKRRSRELSRRFHQREDDPVLSVLRAIEQLESLNRSVTARTIAELVQLTHATLNLYPKVMNIIDGVVKQRLQNRSNSR